MGQNLRISEAQLAELMSRRGSVPQRQPTQPQGKAAAPAARTLAGLMSLAPADLPAWSRVDVRSLGSRTPSPQSRPEARVGTASSVASRPTSPTKRQVQRAVSALNEASVSGRCEGDCLELQFDGAVLLPLNVLFKLSHFQRVPYRRAWHELVARGAQQVLGAHPETRPTLPFTRYLIRAHRQARASGADTDAKNSYFKYVIDGLRYAGVVQDDDERHFRDLLCTQSRGAPSVRLRIEPVAEDYIPLAQRSPWASALIAP